MPAGKVFGSLALAEAVVSHLGRAFEVVIMIGDRNPAASALSNRYSRSPQMRALTRGLVVSPPPHGRASRKVSREWNVHATVSVILVGGRGCVTILSRRDG